jgi:hypothetical protein
MRAVASQAKGIEESVFCFSACEGCHGVVSFQCVGGIARKEGISKG